jgi:hypothetical protein
LDNFAKSEAGHFFLIGKTLLPTVRTSQTDQPARFQAKIVPVLTGKKTITIKQYKGGNYHDN